MTLTKNGSSLLIGSFLVTVVCVLLFYTPLILFSFVVLMTFCFFVVDFHSRARLASKGVKVSRMFSTEKAIQGTSIHVTTEISADQRNMALDVSDQIPRTVDLAGGSNQGALLLGEPTLHLEYDVIPRASGKMAFGPVLIQAKDPLGLSFVTSSLDDFSEVAVLPHSYAPPKSLIRSILVTAALTKPLRGPLWIRSDEFREIREFVSGDSPRDISWRATAKSSTADLFVKEVEKDTEVNLLVVLDASPSTSAGDATQNFLESSINTIMSLFLFASKTNDKFGLLCWGSETKIFVPPEKGVGQLLKLKEALGRIAPQEGYSFVNDSLRFLGNLSKRTSFIIVFSRLPVDYPTILLQTITSLEQRGWRVLLILPDESSFVPPAQNSFQKAVLAVAQELEKERLLKISSLLIEGYRISIVNRPELLPESVGKFIEIRRPKMVAA